MAAVVCGAALWFGPETGADAETRVTGVLDFEFCARDLRAMDLAVALTWWPVQHFGTGAEWPIMQTDSALVDDYRQIADAGRQMTTLIDKQLQAPASVGAGS